MRILLVEDERLLLRNTEAQLKSAGFDVELALTFTIAKTKIETLKLDCVVLDLGLPDGDGMELINILKKQQPKAGLIIVSAKATLDDRLIGLNKGADDYLIKPFHMSELMARLNSILRRNFYEGNSQMLFNEIKIDTLSRKVTVLENQIDLTKSEYELLLFFIINKDKVLSKHAIGEHLLGEHADLLEGFDAIYSHIKNLRKKIIATGGADYIQTVYGIGYKFSEK